MCERKQNKTNAKRLRYLSQYIIRFIVRGCSKLNNAEKMEIKIENAFKTNPKEYILRCKAFHRSNGNIIIKVNYMWRVLCICSMWHEIPVKTKRFKIGVHELRRIDDRPRESVTSCESLMTWYYSVCTLLSAVRCNNMYADFS